MIRNCWKLSLLLAGFPLFSFADYDRGMRAYESWDVSAAVREFESSSAGGDARGDQMLAKIYSGVRNVPDVMQKVLRHTQAAAAAKYGEEMRVIGEAYIQGRFGPIAINRDLDSGVKYLQNSCAAGNSKACFNLAEIYAGWKKIPEINPSPELAKKWGMDWIDAAQKAAIQGNRSALWQVGRSGGESWAGGMDEVTRAMYDILSQYPTARLRQPFYLKISPGQFDQAKALAREWDVKNGIDKTYQPEQVLAEKLVKIGFPYPQVTQEWIEGLASAIAAYRVAELHGRNPKAIAGISWEDLASENQAQLVPLVRDYLARRVACFESVKDSGHEKWTGALMRELDVRQLTHLVNFFESSAGVTWSRLIQNSQPISAKTIAIAQRIRSDPVLAHVGRDPIKRMEAYAAQYGVIFSAVESQWDEIRARDFAFKSIYFAEREQSPWVENKFGDRGAFYLVPKEHEQLMSAMSRGIFIQIVGALRSDAGNILHRVHRSIEAVCLEDVAVKDSMARVAAFADNHAQR